MIAVIHRPLVVGEESLFDSLPDPFPSVPKMSYAAGLAAGGFDPSRTWVSLRNGRVVARAADLERSGFRRIRARLAFRAAAAS